MTEPKDRLKDFRNNKGMSQQRLANELNCSKSLINNIEGGWQKLPYQFALLIQEKYGLRKEWLLDGEGEPYEAKLSDKNPDSIHLEVFKNMLASAGGGCPVFDEIETESIEIPTSKNIKLIKVTGESMYPVMFDGDIVAFDTEKNEIIDGKIYLISIEGELFIKKIAKLTPKRLNIISINKDVSPSFEIDLKTDNVTICGQYSWMIRP